MSKLASFRDLHHFKDDVRLVETGKRQCAPSGCNCIEPCLTQTSQNTAVRIYIRNFQQFSLRTNCYQFTDPERLDSLVRCACPGNRTRATNHDLTYLAMQTSIEY